MLLSLSPLPAGLPFAALPAQAKLLTRARALLLPPSTLPVADLRAEKQRWAELALLQRARRMGLPALAWGNGAALLGRAASGVVEYRELGGSLSGEFCLRAAGMCAREWRDDVPAIWTLGPSLALIEPQPAPELLLSLLEALPAPLGLPASPLEAIGGPEALRSTLTDFYAACRADPLLSPTFARVSDWEAHLSRAQRFWETLLGEGGAQPWRGHLGRIHAPLGISGAQLERWLTLFERSAHRCLSPQGAALLSTRARAMRQRLGART